MIEFLQGFGILCGYFFVCASAALLLRRFVRIPSEVFRKLLHIILLFSLFVWIYAFQTWWIASLAALIFIAIVFPLLSLAEKLDCYSELLTERRNGEIKHSLILVFSMFAVLNSICWGLLGERWLVLACICAWGFGDAAAALIGKKYGRHYLEGKLIEGRKSLEGTLAMFTVSFISVFIVVIPGLVIAILGVMTNTWFWIRYRRLNKADPNSILAIQSRLYSARAVVDTCVTTALIVVAASPGSPAAYFMDIAGSAVVAIYLIINGAFTVLNKKNEESL